MKLSQVLKYLTFRCLSLTVGGQQAEIVYVVDYI